MPILLECSCGKQLRVPDEFAGRRIKCPACSEVQTVPEPAAASPLTAKAPARPAGVSAPTASGMVRFSCTCGKVMQAKAEFAGRSTRCPACQSTLTIPETGEATAGPTGIRADRPAGKPTADVDEDADGDEAPVRRPGRKGRKSQRKSPWLWVGLAAGLLLLIGGGIGAFFWLRGGKVAGEFALVPDDAAMFVSARVGDLWNLDLTKRLLKEAPVPPGQGDLAAQAEQKLGIAPTDVERATMVFMNLDDLMRGAPGLGGMPGGMPGGPQPGGLRPGGRPGAGGPQPMPPVMPGRAEPILFVIVNTAKPYDKQKLLNVLGPNPTETKHKDKSFHTGQGNALYFVDDRTFVVGPPSGVQRAIEQHVAGKKPKEDLAEALKVASGKHHLVGWMRFPSQVKQMAQGAPGGAKGVEGVRDLTATLDLGNALTLDLALGYEKSSQAAEAKKAAEEQMKQLKQSLPALKLMFLGGQPKEVQQLAAWGEKALNGMTIEQSGSAVHFVLKGDLETDAIVGAMKSFASKAGGAAQNLQDANNLKQIALAMHNYHDQHGYFPPAVIYSKDGKKPLYSWRVALLPYLEQDALYKQFKLDEPWNSAHNLKLLSQMPKVYAVPGRPSGPQTHYQVFVTPIPKGAPIPPDGAPFADDRKVRIVDITDGTSNTIMIAEAARAVNWTEPVDINFNPKGSLPALGVQPGSPTFNVAMFDGTVRALKRTISPQTLKAAISSRGGEIVNWDK
jgi:hypothetical protein